MKHNIRFKGVLLMLACALMWSTAGLCIKYVPWSPMVLAGWRGIPAALTLFIGMKWMGLKIVMDGRSLLIGFFVCVVSVLYIVANRLTTAANAVVMQYTSPVFLTVFSILFLKKRYRFRDYAAVLLTFGGIALFFFDKLTTGGTLGNLIAIVDGMAMACVYLFTGESDESRRLSGILWGLVMTSLVGLPFSFVNPPEFSLLTVSIVMAMGIFQLGLPYVLYSIAVNDCPPLACSLISAVEIVLGPLWVLLFLGEAPGKFAIAGSVAILVTITAWCALGGAKPKEGLALSE